MDASREFATLVAKVVELECSDIYGFPSLIDLRKANPERRSDVILRTMRRLSLQGVWFSPNPFRRAQELISGGTVEICWHNPSCGTLKIIVGSREAEGQLGEAWKWKSRRLLCGNVGSFRLQQPDFCSTSSEYLYTSTSESQKNVQITHSSLASSHARYSGWHRQQCLLLSLAIS